ncbi:MAG TPA: serine hydrolase [Pseudonocardia sp.]|uniref:serine hydrolase n=1 Tax=Pseudonocardia sp. TaxID=60912 RepID=UPI002C5AEC13|nr:serine hydrolase [Pseudonocardia sp.]HTF48368.1 serine hydrolase [Pseudonocardia sp.]
MTALDLVRQGVPRLRQAVAERDLGLEGLHIWRDRHAPVTHRWVSDDRRDVFSISKTFTSVAVGIAQAEGLLDLDDPVLAHLLDLRDYLMPCLFEPIAIPNPQWHRCPLGFPLGAVGLFLRTEEIAQLGETLLNNGQFDDRQLVPADYVQLMTSETTATNRPDPDNQTYGLHCWLCSRDGAWRMDGMYGIVDRPVQFPRPRRGAHR